MRMDWLKSWFSEVVAKLYIKWFVRKALPETSPFVYERVTQDQENKQWVCDIAIYGTQREYRVEIHFDRKLFDTLQLSHPPDFEESPLEVNSNSKDSRKEMSFAKKFNRENYRFVSSQPLSYRKPMKVVIPARHLQNGSGRVHFEFETTIGLGGQMIMGSCPIGLGDLESINKDRENREKRFNVWRENNPGWV